MGFVVKKKTNKRKSCVVRSAPFIFNGSQYRGRLPNGRVGLNQIENRNCIELAKKGICIEEIAKATGLTENQVSYRLQMAKVSVMDYRRGNNEEAQVVINRFEVEYL